MSYVPGSLSKAGEDYNKAKENNADELTLRRLQKNIEKLKEEYKIHVHQKFGFEVE